MVTTLWAGLAVGAIYGIVALTYALTLRSTGTFNFAQAQFVTVGVFSAYWLSVEKGVGLWVTVLACVLIAGAVALVQELLVIRRIKGTEEHVALIVTLGVAVTIDGLALALFGTDPHAVPLPTGEATYTVLGGRVNESDLILIAALGILTLSLNLVSSRTSWGLAMRGTAADRDLAAMRGVNVRWVGTGTFVAAGAVAGLLAAPIGTKLFAVFNLADLLVVFAFVALTLGGFASYSMVSLGGLVTGVTGALADRYLNESWSTIVVFGLFLAFLLLRPAGLGAIATQREV